MTGAAFGSALTFWDDGQLARLRAVADMAAQLAAASMQATKFNAQWEQQRRNFQHTLKRGQQIAAIRDKFDILKTRVIRGEFDQ